jgi:hypothetical protein
MLERPELVFIHKGSSWYLPYVIGQATQHNPRSAINVIGDDVAIASLSGSGAIRRQCICDLDQSGSNEFKSNYVHMSSNSMEYELFCWLRWFYLLAYMKKRDLETVFYFDSDVVAFASTQQLASIYKSSQKPCGYLICNQEYNSYAWAASPHVSYWSRDGLEKFCSFALRSFADPDCLSLYKEKYSWHISRDEIGGICDMTTLYLFSREYPHLVENLSERHNGHVIDHNMNTGTNFLADEYRLDSQKLIKHVVFQRGKPCFIPSSGHHELIEADALHFQGDAKKHIPDFCLPIVRWTVRFADFRRRVWRKVLSVFR